VIVVVGSQFDKDALKLVGKWSAWDAALLSADDLSRPGWRVSPLDWRGSLAVVGGSVVPMRNIRGVVTRRPQIFAAELGHVSPADREYVATEMSAFLLCWLSMLPCPVHNSPTPTCLAGPNWSRQQWVRTAALAGLRVRAIRARPSEPEENNEGCPGATVDVTVAGEECVGAPDEDVAASTRRLAAAAGVSFLMVRFGLGEGAPEFLDADPFPDLADSRVSDAVLETLLHGGLAAGAKAGALE